MGVGGVLSALRHTSAPFFFVWGGGVLLFCFWLVFVLCVCAGGGGGGKGGRERGGRERDPFQPLHKEGWGLQQNKKNHCLGCASGL